MLSAYMHFSLFSPSLSPRSSLSRWTRFRYRQRWHRWRWRRIQAGINPSCHNIIVDKAKYAKFIDFAGSAIDGEAPLTCYEWRSFQPGVEIDICTDIFAFGSMLFELEIGRVPYNELERSLETGKLWQLLRGCSQSRNSHLWRVWPSDPYFLVAGISNTLQIIKSIEILHIAVRIIRKRGWIRRYRMLIEAFLCINCQINWIQRTSLQPFVHF